MKYITGQYQVLMFDDVGHRVKKSRSQSYNESIKLAKEWLEKHPECSAVVNRTIWNSKGTNTKWEYI